MSNEVTKKQFENCGLVRLVRRALIIVNGTKYWAKELEVYDGKTVVVKPSREGDGINVFYQNDWLCVAKRVKTVKFPKASIEQARAKSMKARVERKQAQIDAMVAERSGVDNRVIEDCCPSDGFINYNKTRYFEGKLKKYEGQTVQVCPYDNGRLKVFFKSQFVFFVNPLSSL